MLIALLYNFCITNPFSISFSISLSGALSFSFPSSHQRGMPDLTLLSSLFVRQIDLFEYQYVDSVASFIFNLLYLFLIDICRDLHSLSLHFTIHFERRRAISGQKEHNMEKKEYVFCHYLPFIRQILLELPEFYLIFLEEKLKLY